MVWPCMAATTIGIKDREEIPTVGKDVTRQSPQIDLLSQQDNAVRQEADIAFLASPSSGSVDHSGWK